MACDRRAAKSLEYADLDLVRARSPQPVEAAAERREVLAGQADDEVRVQVHAGVLAQPLQVGEHLVVVLPPRDRLAYLRIERLHADFELQHAFGELRDRFLERVGQAVRDQFEVHEQPRPQALQEELEDRDARLDVEVERAVDELEVRQPAVVEPLHARQEVGERRFAHAFVERRQAELARERAAARRLDVDDAVRDVDVVVLRIRIRELFEVRRRGVDHARLWAFAAEELLAEFREHEVAFAAHDVVRVAAHRLRVGFVAHLGAAEHDDDFGSDRLEHRDQLRRRLRVPDVDAEADDARRLREDLLGDVGGPVLDVELDDRAVLAQVAEVGAEATQPEGCVDPLRVQCGEDDGGHAMRVGLGYRRRPPTSRLVVQRRANTAMRRFAARSASDSGRANGS